MSIKFLFVSVLIFFFGLGNSSGYISSNCEVEEYDGSHGSFKSPNYPYSYPNNHMCYWEITANVGDKIELRFEEHFAIESNDCTIDHILIRDGGADSHLIGKYCGEVAPSIITSNSNILWIQFNTDYSVGKAGFSASYTIISPNTPKPILQNHVHLSSSANTKIATSVFNSLLSTMTLIGIKLSFA